MGIGAGVVLRYGLSVHWVLACKFWEISGYDLRLYTGCMVCRCEQERSPAINRKLCMQAKAGAESLPAGGEGVVMNAS